MADEVKRDPSEPPEGEQPAGDEPAEGEGEELDPSSEIKPGMSEAEIRDAGLAIDVPYESGMAQPQRLKYGEEADFGPLPEYPKGGETEGIEPDEETAPEAEPEEK